MLNTAFMPDFVRLPIIASYHTRVRYSLRSYLQSSVDAAVRKELQAALGIASVNAIPIPNAVSNFLELDSQSGLEEAFDGLISQFTQHKKAIVNWENRLRTTNKNGYGEIQKVIDEVKESLAALESIDKTEIMMSVVPGLAADLIGGSFGPGSVVGAAEKALSQLRRWRQRTRISFFNTGKKEAARIPNQSELLEKAFGRTLTPRQTERFLMLSDSLQKLSQPAI